MSILLSRNQWRISEVVNLQGLHLADRVSLAGAACSTPDNEALVLVSLAR